MNLLQLEMKGFLKNYTYLIVCNKSKNAAIVDPGCFALFPSIRYRRIFNFLKRRYNLKYIINTHHHFDHIGGNRFLEKKTNAKIISYISGLRSGDKIDIGELSIDVLETPGHAYDSITIHYNGNLLTGDTLFVGDSGATVTKDSDRNKLGESLRNLIEKFPPETTVWPGHNFGNRNITNLETEQKTNINSLEYRLQDVSFSK